MPSPLLIALFLLLVVACQPPARAQNDDALPALVQLLGQTDDAQFQLDLLKGMSEGLKGRRNVPMPADWDKVAAKLARSPNAQVQELTRSLSLTFGSANAMADLRRQLADPSAPADVRQRALAALLEAKDSQLPGWLRPLLKEPSLRAPALRGLAAYDDPATPTAILEIYPQLNVAERRDALNTLVSRAAFAAQLLSGVRDSVIPARDLTADLVRQLRQFKDPMLNQQVEKLWGVARDSGAGKLEEIAGFKAKLQSAPAGDPHRGRAVFTRICHQCHTLFGTGGKVGPDITGSNRADLDYVLHNILDPNAEIPNDYRTSTVETKDDRVITGIVTRQDDNAVAVVTANDTILLPRAEVKEIQQSELSMMPEGLAEVLLGTELADLIAYLKSPAQVPMTATEENLGEFFNGIDLLGWDGNFELWKVEQGEIVGKTQGLKRNEWLAGPLWLGDFRFVCQVKLTPNTENSGIQFRSQRLDNGEVKGCQADAGAGWWGKLYEEHGRALLWKQSGEAHVKPGDWNTYEILAVGDHIRTAINGHVCVDMQDPQGARQGVLAFQLHAGGALEVRYRNLQLELNPTLELKTARVE